MKIAFDAKRAFFNLTGLGNYSRNLINGLAQYFPENDYYLCTPSSHINLAEQPLFALPNGAKIVAPTGTLQRLAGGSWWRTWGIAGSIAPLDIQVYHGLSHELPRSLARKVRKVVTIHDLLPWRYPQYYSLWDRTVYKNKWQHACRVADAIVAVSQQTKQDLIDFMQVAERKISVIAPPIDPMYYDYGDAMYLQHGFFVTQQYDIPYPIPQKYLLYVGSLSERKNVWNLLKALHLLLPQQPDTHLVLVGNGSDDYVSKLKNYVQTAGITQSVSFLHQVAPQHLPALYRCAELVVYPSLFEGFGMPIVEGLFSRTPVVTSSGGCFAEAGGATTAYIPQPEQAESIAQTIQSVRSSPAMRMNMIVDGWNHAQQFTVQHIVQQMYNLYQA